MTKAPVPPPPVPDQRTSHSRSIGTPVLVLIGALTLLAASAYFAYHAVDLADVVLAIAFGSDLIASGGIAR